MPGPNDFTGKYPSVTYPNLIQQVNESSSKLGNVYNGLGDIAYILPMVASNDNLVGTSGITITVNIPAGCLAGWFYVVYSCILKEDGNTNDSHTRLRIRRNGTVVAEHDFILRNGVTAKGEVHAEVQQIVALNPNDTITAEVVEVTAGWDAKNHRISIQRCHNLNP